MWVWHMVKDFFFAFGVLVFLGVLVVVAFFDGSVENVSTGWLIFPPMVYSYLMGELYRWPREEKEEG